MARAVLEEALSGIESPLDLDLEDVFDGDPQVESPLEELEEAEEVEPADPTVERN